MLDSLANNPGPTLAAAIVLIGLFGLGFKDLLHLSPTRLWAVSTVVVQQAFRRRVLWITPVLILGIITVSQLQRSIDAQDVIRQTTLVCLFATGLLVILMTIILAATNLPREIDNRVIYTIATKPVTRLEIVLGKAVGFARVSFWLLLIMGIFAYAYLHLRNYSLRNYVAAQLAIPGAVDDHNRGAFEYYRDHGMLHARELGLPESLNIYSRLPATPNDRWIPGAGEGEMFARFLVDPKLIPPPDPAADPTSARGGLVLQLPILYQPVDRNPQSPTTGPTTRPQPRIHFALTNATRSSVLSPRDIGAPEGIPVPQSGMVLNLLIAPKSLADLLPSGPDAPPAELRLSVTGGSDAYEYSLNPDQLLIAVPETRQVFRPVGNIAFLGRDGAYGQQLHGGPSNPNRVAVYRFSGQKPPSAAQSHLFQVRLGVERLEEEATTFLSLEFVNRDTGKRAPPIQTTIETNRPIYLNVPSNSIESGNFDVLIRTPSNAWLGLRDGGQASIKFVKSNQSFAFNLVKSLFVLWLLALLVGIIAIFASTFLSWPIAVVLTLVILSGRWTAEQFLDVQSSSGIGRQIVNDLMPRDIDAASAKAVSSSVDALVATLHSVAVVLPDISQFAAIQDIENGISIAISGIILPALLVTLGFGLPLLILAYVILKHKEVAP